MINADRQADRQTLRQTDRQTDRQRLVVITVSVLTNASHTAAKRVCVCVCVGGVIDMDLSRE